MQVYSKEILKFNQKCIRYIKSILSNEFGPTFGVKLGRTRFFYKGYYYPISVASFQDERESSKKILGQFSEKNLKILVNFTMLKAASDFTLIDLLRHETAHYINYIHHGSSVLPHGKEFVELCQKLGWGVEVYGASIEEKTWDSTVADKEKKLKKLLALSKSNNEHEATLALKKAQDIITQYGISSKADEEEVYFLKILDTLKRKNAKLQAIYDILEAMNFAVIFHYTFDDLQFETYGTWEQVSHCEEVFHFLNASLDEIWRAQTNLSGIQAKTSFFIGFSQAVTRNLEIEQREFSKEQRQNLVKYQEALTKAKEMIYPRLKSSHSQQNIDLTAFRKGFKNGENFNTNYQKHRFLPSTQ